MAKIGSVMTPVGRKALLLGSGELGKEVALELQRYGIEVVACDRKEKAPQGSRSIEKSRAGQSDKLEVILLISFRFQQCLFQSVAAYCPCISINPHSASTIVSSGYIAALLNQPVREPLCTALP